MTDGGEVQVAATNVTKVYRNRKRGLETALNDVSVAIRSGETLGIVGQSGSGKTTLSRLLLGIEQPTAGEVHFRGMPLPRLDKRQRQIYREAVAAVFQNPYSSLDPRMRIWQIIAEQLVIEHRMTRKERKARAGELLDTVGLDPDMVDRYPRQLSG